MTTDTSIDLAIGGAVMPYVIALINQNHWSPKLRGAVAFLACLVGAAVLAYWHGALNWGQWRDTAIIVTGPAMVMYHALWKPSGLAPAVEDATTFTAPSAP